MSSKRSLSQMSYPNSKKFSHFKSGAALNRFLDRLPPDIADSFSPEQLIAMQEVLQRQPHAIDIRLTVPLIWQRIYCVLLIGPERRSEERRQTDRSHYNVWTTANLLFITGFISLSLLSLIGLLNLKLSVLEKFSPSADYPTSIPFKDNRADCEKSGRFWEDGECIDYDHSPTF